MPCALLIYHLIIIISIICILIAIAYTTLLERRVLGAAQLRLGPNKPRIIGILTPIADAIKLITKIYVVPSHSNKLLFQIAPFFILFLSFIIVTFYPSISYNINPLSTVIYLLISRLAVYPVLIAGSASNSKYALLGAVRALAQTISYEVCISLVALSALTINLSYSLNSSLEGGYFRGIIFPLIFGIWLITALAETNRTPFDLVEGESELVRGYNVEYRGGGFTLIFIAEYTNIVIISIVRVRIWLFCYSYIFLVGLSIFVILFILIIRATAPRIRYDQLIYLNWLYILPLVLALFLLLRVII